MELHTLAQVAHSYDNPFGHSKRMYMYVYSIFQEEDLYQEAEPIVASGITAALQLANKKGFIEEGKR